MKNFYSLPLRTGDSRKVIKCQICPAAQAAFRIFAGNNLVYKGSLYKGNKRGTLSATPNPPVFNGHSRTADHPASQTPGRFIAPDSAPSINSTNVCLRKPAHTGDPVICGSRKIRLPRQTAASNLSGTLQSPRTVHGTRSRLRTGNVCSFSNPACKGPHT